ncbi:hypothetical protein BH10PLA2_BH10PLA2_14260 [soil metagenome]
MSQSLFLKHPRSMFYPPSRFPALLSMVILLAAVSNGSTDFERTQKQGEVTCRLAITTNPEAPAEPPAIRLSGEILTLEITGPKDLQVTAPDGLVKVKGWTNSRMKPDEVVAINENQRQWRRSYRLDPDRPGPANLQIGELQIRTSSGARKITWPPISTMVVTSIQRVAREELLDKIPLQPYDVDEPTSFVVPIWLAAALLALGLVTMLTIRYRRAIRYRQEDPGHWLRRRIEELRPKDQREPEAIARFYSDLADLFRHYMERRFAVPSPTHTTREFLGDVQASATLDEHQRALLEQFLTRCDLVKFAREAPTQADCDAAVELVLRFFDRGNAVAAAPSK